MDIERAMRRPFTNVHQFFIGGLVQLVPILNFVNLGYALRNSGINGKVKDRLENYDMGEDFKQGFYSWVIGLVYGIPVMVAVIVGIIVITAMVMNGADPGVLLLGVPPLILLGILMFFYIILIAIMMPAAKLYYYRRQELGEAFRFKDIARRVFTRDYMLAFLLVLAVSIGFGLVLMPLYVLVSIPYVQYLFMVPYWYATALAGYASLMISFTLYGEVLSKK
ncbi:MAG: DUF4013 domain-containing protein [Nanoarchaeota archaeon]|nr:DUF4013 domain-containing protein [Nanoarchaeota archaeon]